MNKQFGYQELKMSFGMLPIKVGMYTIEGLCQDFGITLYDLPTIMEVRPVTVEGQEVHAEIPKDPIKFFRSILLHSANYIKWRNGEELYAEKDAYDWMEEIGFATPIAFSLIALFRQVARSGVSAPQTEEKPAKRQKKS